MFGVGACNSSDAHKEGKWNTIIVCSRQRMENRPELELRCMRKGKFRLWILWSFVSFFLISCQISSTPESTIAEFHELLAKGREGENYSGVTTERYQSSLDALHSRTALRQVLIKRNILRQSAEGVTVAPGLKLEVHYPEKFKAQVKTDHSGFLQERP